MKYKLLSLLILLSLCLPLRAANIDYRALRQDQFTTNIPSAYYVGIKGYGVTNVPGTNVQLTAGTGITFTTNAASITITATGTNQVTITNIVVRAGTDIRIDTNGPTDWTVNTTNFWTTNAAIANSVSNKYAGARGAVWINGGIVVGNAGFPGTDNSIEMNGGRLANSTWAVNQLLYSDSGLVATNLFNGTGALTNNGSGAFGWFPVMTTNIVSAIASNADFWQTNAEGAGWISNKYPHSVTIHDALWIRGPSTNQWLIITNGTMAIPGFDDVGADGVSGAIHFNSDGYVGLTSPGAHYIINFNHRGPSNTGQLLISHDSIALEEQQLGQIVLGNDGTAGGIIRIRPDSAFGATLTTNGHGNSHVMLFEAKTKGSDNVQHNAYPAIVGYHTGVTNDNFVNDPNGNFGASGGGELAFYTHTPWPQPTGLTLSDSVEIFRMLTNGTSFKFQTWAPQVTATNGFTSRSNVFTLMPTNTPTDAYVLTATGTAGDTAWKVAAGGTSVVVAGTNVTVVTNGNAYTVSSTGGGTASIGPGTTNYIAKFTSTTNVGDSIVVEEATNQWAWRSRPTSTPYTNSITNILYHEWTAANNYKALEISTPKDDNSNVHIRQNRGSAVTQVFTGMTFNDAWTINGLGTVAAGGHNGDLLPEADSDGSTGLTVGNGSHRIKNITAWQLIVPDQATGTTPTIDASTYSQQFKPTGIYWYLKTGPNQLLSLNNVSGLAAFLNLGATYLAASAGQDTNFDTFMRRGNEANTWTFTTNSGANTAPVSRLEGAESNTADKPGGDIVILGGRSKGTGLPGAVRVQTVEPAAASSSSINDNKTDRVYIAPRAVSLTTNSATLVFNFTVPATLNVVGGRVFATTRITDGTEVASMSEEFSITALRKVNTVTCTNSVSVPSSMLGTGSAAIANTWTVVANAQSVDVKLNCVTSGITSTNSTVRWRFEADSDAVPVITPQ